MPRRAARFAKSRYTRYSSVSYMSDELEWPLLSQRRQEVRLILFYKIINRLAQVPFEGVLIEAYTALEGITIINSNRLVIHLDSMDSRFSLKLLVHGSSVIG